MTRTTRRWLPRRNIELVLGAGGAMGPAHIGTLQAIEEHGLSIGRITGASVGSLIGTFIANGYDSAELKKIFLSDDFRYPEWSVWQRCLHLADPWNLFPWAIDFAPWLEHVTKKYNLKAQKNLRLVAADALSKAPIVFEGTDYDLVTGLTASTAAISGLGMRPVWYSGDSAHKDGNKSCNGFGHICIDGFYFHPIPASLCDSPAIVSKIGFARQLPSERLSPWELMMHMREMSLAPLFDMKFPDPSGHVIVEAGLPDVACTTFGLSTRTFERLIENGYRATCKRLSEPDAIEMLSKREPARR